MNRRSFLSKICGLLPFGVGLAVTGGAGASEGQRGSGTRTVTEEEFQDALTRAVKDKLKCYGQNGTLCPRCKFNYPTLKEVMDAEELKRQELRNYPAYIIHEDGSLEPIPYEEFYKDSEVMTATKIREGWEELANRIDRLRIEAAEKAANPPVIVNPNGDILISVGGDLSKTYFFDEINGDDKNDGLTWRTARKNWDKTLEEI